MGISQSRKIKHNGEKLITYNSCKSSPPQKTLKILLTNLMIKNNNKQNIRNNYKVVYLQ